MARTKLKKTPATHNPELRCEEKWQKRMKFLEKKLYAAEGYLLDSSGKIITNNSINDMRRAMANVESIFLKIEQHWRS